MENGLCEKSTASWFRRPISYIGKSTIQAELEAFGVGDPEFLADDVARLARGILELVRLAGAEEHGVACLEAELFADRLRALGAEILGHGARAAVLAPEDIGQARQAAFLLGPAIHPVAEGAGAAAGGGDGADLGLGVFLEDAREDTEAAAREVFGDRPAS